MSSISTIDLVFVIITGIFILTAVLRGFVREVFAILNWIAALLLSHLLTPIASKIVLFYTDNTLVADIVTRTVLFVAVFVGVMLTTSGLSSSLRDKIPLMADRILGVTFAIFKSILIFGIVYSVILNIGAFATGDKQSFSPRNFESQWLSNAKTKGIIKSAGVAVNPLVKTFLNSIIGNFDRSIRNKGKLIPDQKDLNKKINNIIEEGDEIIPDSYLEDKDSGYNQKEIKKMDRLIEIVN